MSKKKKKFYPLIAVEECKGCERCANACPVSVLEMSKNINNLGYPTVVYIGDGCIGCGACFYNCPEPSAITVIKEEDDDDE